MPVQPTYPGVYIEEISSGVHTITGVATSITAFIGRASEGPVNQPTTINSFGDYGRIFGGLAVDSTMSYAVQDFYLNGGSQAIIVRIVAEGRADPTQNAATAFISLVTGAQSPPNDALLIYANSPGAWGNTLSAAVDYNTGDPFAGAPSSPASPPNPTAPATFNLTIYDNGTKVEQFLAVSLDPTTAVYLPRVLQQQSNYVLVGTDASGNITGNVPAVTSGPVPAGGQGSDGGPLVPLDYLGGANGQATKTGMYALQLASLFNLLCIPPPVRGTDTDPSVWKAAMAFCQNSKAFLIVDAPMAWGANPTAGASNVLSGLSTVGLSGTTARNAALYFPLVLEADPLRNGQVDTFVPSGMIAGVMAATDTSRGVWKSPAGIDASLTGITGLQLVLTDAEHGQLNPIGINCLRSFPVTGNVIWGARTLRGADQLADDDYKYVAVRRFTLFLELSLYQGTQWVVFEPNAAPLWSQIRLTIGAFMQNLFRQGAFAGTTPNAAYLVKCDSETTTQNDINNGVVNILVAFAPLKPAEFVVIQIQQMAGQVNT